MLKQELIIEKADSGFLGRVQYDDNLIVDEANTLQELESQMRNLLHDFHDLDPTAITFDIKYDLSSLFEKFAVLKISTVAELAGINSSLLRQYVNGIKHPSEAQAKKIEETLHDIGSELKNISVHGK